MVIWRSHDRGESWSSFRQVTHDSPRNHNYARRPINQTDPFWAFWADGDPTQLSESRLYFSDSDGKRVWELPYEMSGDWATPELVTFQETEQR